MATIVHARLDTKSEQALSKLRTKLGWTDSLIIRQGILTLAQTTLNTQKSRIIGIGKFESGIGDLSFNKKHLRGFGK